MPKRPPKKWIRKCIKSVKELSGNANPGAVCGNMWYNKLSSKKKSQILKKEKLR